MASKKKVYAMPSLVAQRMVQMSIPDVGSVPNEVDNIEQHMAWVVLEGLKGNEKANSKLPVIPEDKRVEFVREIYFQVVGIEPGLTPELKLIRGTLGDDEDDAEDS